MARLPSLPPRTASAVRRAGPALVRLAASVIVLWFVWRQVGGAGFRDGLRAATWPAAVAAVAITAATTVCAAWRWRAVARALGVDIGLGAAVRAYYRSQLLNSVLIGGVVGDVDRALRHGRQARDVARGVRAAVWDRLCGQLVQAVVTVVVLLALPSPLRSAVPYVLAGLVVTTGAIAIVMRRATRSGRQWATRAAQVVSADLRHGLLAPAVWPGLVLPSALIVAGHTALFVIAARVAGSPAPLGELIALVMVVQIAMVIPVGVGGWGVREGAAAWAFGAAGFGASSGVSIAVLYAVLMLLAVSPGAVLLVLDAVRRRPMDRQPDDRQPAPDDVARHRTDLSMSTP